MLSMLARPSPHEIGSSGSAHYVSAIDTSNRIAVFWPPHADVGATYRPAHQVCFSHLEGVSDKTGVGNGRKPYADRP